MKSYSIFLPVGFLAFWISGCASNPHVVYEPVVIQTQPTWVHRAPHNPSLRQTTNVAQSQNWSVLTDPVVLDLDSQSQDPEYSDVTNVSVTQNYYVDESGLSLDDQVDLYAQCRLDYCYDQYYYPVPTTTYWYYNAYPTVWYDDGGYYNDYYNYNDYYVYYPYYSGYGWGYPSRRVVTVYDPYYSSAFYYSGYYPASY